MKGTRWVWRFRFILPPSSFLLFALSLSGCSDSGDRLVVATWWPRDDRLRIESKFREWLDHSGRDLSSHRIELEWRIAGGWDDRQPELVRRSAPDVLLGASIESLEQLARGGRIKPVSGSGLGPYLVLRAGEIRLADRSGRPPGASEQIRYDSEKDGAGRAPAGTVRSVTFDDPRSDPVSRAWAASLLDSKHFREGYAQLVFSAGTPRRIGRCFGAARGAVECGEAGLSPVWIARGSGAQVVPAGRRIGSPAGGGKERLPEAETPPRLVEGAAVVAGSRNELLAGQFLRFLAETRTRPPASESTSPDSQADSKLEDLLADMVGATLVDAQDELWAACAALERARDPEPARSWMTEPPPWPPASIARLLARGDSEALNLMQALAREIAPDAAVRAELIRSWLAPARVVDRGVLAEVAHLAGGRLATEPRFRAWLNAEWTAWARQRFRRVERLAATRQGAEASSELPKVRP